MDVLGGQWGSSKGQRCGQKNCGPSVPDSSFLFAEVSVALAFFLQSAESTTDLTDVLKVWVGRCRMQRRITPTAGHSVSQTAPSREELHALLRQLERVLYYYPHRTPKNRKGLPRKSRHSGRTCSPETDGCQRQPVPPQRPHSRIEHIQARISVPGQEGLSKIHVTSSDFTSLRFRVGDLRDGKFEPLS